MDKNTATFVSQIRSQKDAEQAALHLVTGIVEQYEAAGSDLNKINGVTAELKATKGALAEAVVANTARA